MDTTNFFVFVIGFSFLMVIHTGVRSYLNNWDRSYLVCSFLFASVLINCLFWTTDIAMQVRKLLGCEESADPGNWFNHLNPLLLVLLYREFLNVKEDSTRMYKFLTYTIWLIGLTIIIQIVLVFFWEPVGWFQMVDNIFLITLLSVFTVLPIYTLKFFKHPYYRFVALSSWVIWILYGSFLVTRNIESIHLISPEIVRSGKILFVILIIDGLLFLVALSVKDKMVSANKVKFEQEMLKFKLKSLQNQINPHFIFNSLNAIKGLNLEGHYEKAIHYLDEFGKLLRQILIQSNRPSISLSQEIKNLRRYLSLEKLRLNNKFVYFIEIDEEVETELIEIPSLLIQPYLENAVWHGISSPVISQGVINITISTEPDLVVVQIQDNGIGYNQSLQNKNDKTARQSYGMEINHNRITSIASLSKQMARVKITDLSTINPANQGTEIVLEIPILR